MLLKALGLFHNFRASIAKGSCHLKRGGETRAHLNSPEKGCVASVPEAWPKNVCLFGMKYKNHVAKFRGHDKDEQRKNKEEGLHI